MHSRKLLRDDSQVEKRHRLKTAHTQVHSRPVPEGVVVPRHIVVWKLKVVILGLVKVSLLSLFHSSTQVRYLAYILLILTNWAHDSVLRRVSKVIIR